MGELRQKFESRLSEKVKHILLECNFNSHANRYYYCDSERVNDFNLGVINGAWYMFFEDFERQQSKIEELEKRINNALSQINSGSFVVNEIRDALRGKS